jgi:Kef-type K+ transport system membrane component KefB
LVPLLFRKLRIPPIIGLILSGLLVGPYGLNLLRRDSSIVLFGTVGLLYIMFLAALEMDLHHVRKNIGKILAFGLITFLLPLVFGTLASLYLLQFSFVSSLLLASLFSSHTLVSYPIVSSYKLTKHPIVTLAIGGTLVTDILALMILAGVSGSLQEESSHAFWLQLSASSIVFVIIVLFGFPRLTRYFFQKVEESVARFVFVLTMMLFASFLAELAGLEAILGAFLAGLSLGAILPLDASLLRRITFVGDALFIPFFLISVGMLVDLRVLGHGWYAITVALTIVVIAIVTKYLAAWLIQKLFRYSAQERSLLYGLSLSRAAATLAIVLVGYNTIIGETASGEPIRLLNEDVLNGTILLILVSCAISSFVVESAARKISAAAKG